MPDAHRADDRELAAPVPLRLLVFAMFRGTPIVGGANRTRSALTLAALVLAAAGLWAAGARAADDPPPNGHELNGAESLLAAAAVTPRILSADDASRYRAIFALQEDRAWQEADHLIDHVENPILMGHVQFQRYMHATDYRSKFVELSAWMKAYRDHPSAIRIYRLALRRQPANYRSPPDPQPARLETGEAAPTAVEPPSVYRSPRNRTRTVRNQVRAEQNHIRLHLRRGQTASATKALNGEIMRQVFDEVEYDQIRWEIASAYYFQGDDETALELAAASAARSREHVEIADWTAGLAAWRLGRHDEAARHFAALASSTTASGWNAAAGAYWAARAALVVGRPEEVTDWLTLGARHPRTFYGLLAARLLGQDVEFEWLLPPLSAAEFARIGDNPAVQRAIALAEVGQHHLAERELAQLYKNVSQETAEALLGLASRLGLPASEMRLANAALDEGSPFFDSASFPVPQWRPANGFSIDRALVYAFIRQESRFNTQAKSPAGARGLMQLMPRTASFVAQDRSLRRSKANTLFEPDLNLDIGQRYIQQLLADEIVSGNLFLLAAAYNGGPGNLSKWMRRTQYDDDALLFIESIPSRETRLFVERVLTNMWIYRSRLGQDTPSLDAVAAGHWPYYFALDGHGEELDRLQKLVREATIQRIRFGPD